MKSEKEVFALPEPSPFSCDLVAESQKHIRFLRGLHDQGVTLKPPSFKSLDRYLYFWLPLVADNAAGDVKLIPPPDIAWLWHCHRLAPMAYERYVQERYHRVLETSPSFVFQADKENAADARRTRNFWHTLYPSEPFFLQESDHQQSFPETDSPGRCLNGFDLVASAERQSTFLWQVSDFHFQETDFLQDGVKRYYQFLKLPGKQGQSLVPTFQIDLMWHTHILVSLQKYHNDCVKIRGEKLEHDDSLHDHTSSNKLDKAFQQTAKVWKETYGCDYVVPVGTYRDELPSTFYDRRLGPVVVNRENTGSVLAVGSYSYDEDDNLSTTLAVSTVSTTETRTDAGSRLPWLNPKDSDAQRDGKRAFIPIEPKSRGRGVQKKEGYVFGRGEAGLGYYSFDTREAYKILYQRIRRKQYEQLEEYNSVHCRQSLCGVCKPTDHEVQQQAAMLDEATRLGAMAECIKARYDSTGPTAELPQEVVETYGARANMQTAVSGGSVVPYDIYAGGFDVEAFCNAAGCEDANG